MILFLPKNPPDFCQKEFIFSKRSARFLQKRISFLPKNPPDFSQKEFYFYQKIRLIFAKNNFIILFLPKSLLDYAIIIFYFYFFQNVLFVNLIPLLYHIAARRQVKVKVYVRVLVSVTRTRFLVALYHIN